MALRKNETNNTRQNSRQGNDFEKAAGFINIDLPTRDGKTLRLIAVPLTVESKAEHAQLFDYLTVGDKGKPLSAEEQAARMEQLKSRIVLSFGMTRSDEDRALALF